MIKEKRDKPLNNVKCECGYQNLLENVQRYGTCRLCGKVLDPKAKFDYEMYVKLKRWRKGGKK